MRSLALADAVNFECNVVETIYIPQMLEVHKFIKTHNVDNVLEVKFEDFAEDYDKTTRSIFEHFLGKENAMVDTLVTKAREHDINRRPPSDNADDHHISSDDEEAQVYSEMKKRLEAG